MKKIIITIIGIFCLTSVNYSQDLFPMGVGPSLSYSLGVNANDVPKGRKNGLAFSNIPDFGINYYLPFTENANLGLSLDLSYATYSYQMKNYFTNAPYNFYFHSFEINPNFYFAGFTFGFNMNIPLAAEIDNGEDISDMINTTFGVKVGGIIPIYWNETGRINFIIEGNYNFTGIYSDYPDKDAMSKYAPPNPANTQNSSLNPRNASVSFGFSYIFNLSKPKQYQFEE